MLNKEQYITVKTTWKQQKEHTIHEHIIYNVLRGKEADEGFAPLTDWGRLHASQDNPWFSYDNAVLDIHYRLNPKRYQFEGTVKYYSELFGIEFTNELIEEVLSKIKRK
jgi:hypothetical protein